ncbi:MAG TPA: thiamine-phosphate kinase [Candidatus Acidoferrum sp.]|nr:thiamine-phosphate kinase [Candidatus Acidoferrum sp.]
MHEDELVRKISKAMSLNLGSHPQLRLSMGDDAALFRARPGHELILTCDWFLEGTHFLIDKHPPDSVGWKSLARAVSDVAAMGGVPRCFLLSLAIPSSHTGRWLDQFLSGLRRASRKFRCALAGGDTTRRSQILMNITVIGEVRTGFATLRSGARPGDLIYVSGWLGEADIGLQFLKRSKQPASTKDRRLRKHLYPEPRLTLGQWLAEKRLASAMMDLSDGLSSDLPRLCFASGAGAYIESSHVPLAQGAVQARKSGLNPLRLAVHGGDDYELLFTVPPQKKRLVPRTFRGFPLTPIGVITADKRIVVVDKQGRKESLDPGGWDPFRATR